MSRLNVRIHPAGWVLLAVLLLFTPTREALALVGALAWHEAGHVAALCGLGARRVSIELTPFGGMIDAQDMEKWSPGKQAAAALSGVAASAAASLLCLWFAPRTAFWYAFWCAHTSLALLNCLPLWPLDGARALAALAARLGMQRAFCRVMRLAAYAFSVSMVGLGLYGAWHGHVNLSLFLLGPYLCYAASQATLGGQVRRLLNVHDALPPPGALYPVACSACTGDPDAAAMTRLLTRTAPGRMHVLCVLDEQTGRLRGTMTQCELAQRLFAGDSSKPGIGTPQA